MQVLESSFAIESQNDSLLALVQGMGNEDDENDENNEDIIKLSPESAEAVRNSVERYIRER